MTDKFGTTSMKLDANPESTVLDNLVIPAGSTVGFWTQKGYKVYINGELVQGENVLVLIVNENEA